MTPSARIAILPRQIASEVITASVARGGWAVATVLIVLDIPVLIDVLAKRRELWALPVPLVVLVIFAVMLVLGMGQRSSVQRLLLIGGAAVAATVYASALLCADASLADNAAYLLNRPAVAVALMSPVVVRPLLGLAWSGIGLLLAVASLIISFAITGVTFAPGWGTFTAAIVYALVFVVLSVVRASQSAAVPDLPKLEEETRRMAIESQFEQRAAAMIHDTVLGDLMTVMNSAGVLDDRVRARFRSDVATLKRPADWLREVDVKLDTDDRDAALRNGSIALASEMQWRGLTVDLTGQTDVVVQLSAERTETLHRALRACLENVLEHSGESAAQLVAGGNADEVNYMVIDHGIGFDPAAVPADRAGLRDSVVAPVEAFGGSVRIWSQPGNGTSVLISMPIGPSDD